MCPVAVCVPGGYVCPEAMCAWWLCVPGGYVCQEAMFARRLCVPGGYVCQEAICLRFELCTHPLFHAPTASSPQDKRLGGMLCERWMPPCMHPSASAAALLQPVPRPSTW